MSKLELPTEAEFRAASDASELLHLAIRSHGEVEIALRVAVADALTEPHELELERLTFPLKLDLAIALGIIPSDIRPLFLKLNKIRNTFAHDSRASFGPREAQELLGTMPASHREGVRDYLEAARTPRDTLRIAFVVAFYQAKGAAENVRNRKQRLAELRRDTEAYLATVRKTDAENSE